MSSTGTILAFLTRLSEAGDGAVLRGRAAKGWFGPAFDRLLRRGVLVEEGPADAWPVCRGCDCGLDARPVRFGPDGPRAVCPVDAGSDEPLDEADLRRFRLDVARLADLLARSAGLGERAEPVLPGVRRLGATSTGRVVFHAATSSALEAPGAPLALRTAAGGAPATLLAPEAAVELRLAFAAASIDLVATASVLRPDGDGPGRLDLAALEPAASAPRLAFRRRAGEVRLDGLAVTLSHQLAPVFGRMVDAARSRDPVASATLIEGASGREAKDLVREIRDAFRAAGVPDAEVKALIPNARGRGWRIGLPASEIAVEP